MLYKKLISKIGKSLVKYGITNNIRIFGLKILGCKIGNNVYIGEDMIIINELNEKCNIFIGDRVSIAPRATLILSSHANNSHLNNPLLKGYIKIEDDSWIGTNVVISPNVTIGKSSIIGAMSLINKDIKCNSMYFGIPAKYIKDITNLVS